jgi:succinoglycan biosynthesis transport protein ExoP
MSEFTAIPAAAGRPSSLVRLVRARLIWIVAVTLVVAGSAAVFSWSQARVYQSTADVVVLSVVAPGASPPSPPRMATEKEMVTSDVVASVASRRLGVPIGQLRRQVSVTVPADAQVMQITCAAADAASARSCAQGAAQAYVDYKDSQPIATIPERGRIISPAPLPLTPSAPNIPLNVAAGVLVGLVLGFLTALIRDRVDDRIRGIEDLREHGLRVLGTLPEDRGPGMPATVAAAEACSAIAEKVRRATRSTGSFATPVRGQVVVLTGVDTDQTPTTAVPLAVALARGGDRVVCVDADAQKAGAVWNTPGLLDVVAGRTPLAAAMQAKALPNLTMIEIGGRESDSAARVGTRAWTQTAGALTEAFDHVVVEAPPILAPDTARILEPASAVVLVVDSRTTRSALGLALEELDQLGAPVIGGILLTRRRSTRLGAAKQSRCRRRAAGTDAPDVIDQAQGRPGRPPEQLPEPHLDGQPAARPRSAEPSPQRDDSADEGVRSLAGVDDAAH